MRNLIEKKKSPLTVLYTQPPAVRLLSASLLFLAILLVGILFLMRHAHVQSLQMETQKAQLEREVTQQSTVYEEFRYFSKNTLVAKKAYDALLQTFPSRAHMDDLLSDITKIGTQDGVKFISFKPQAETTHDYYAAVPVDIAVVGGYHPLAKFLSDIANLPRSAIVVNQFTMTQTDKQDGLLSLNFVATLYHTLPTSAEVKP